VFFTNSVAILAQVHDAQRGQRSFSVVLRIKVMPTESAYFREDEELMSRREHNRFVQTILASRGARPFSTEERPVDAPPQTSSLVSEESVIVVSVSDDSQEGEGTSLKWELITNKLLTAWELDNRKVAIQNLRTHWSKLGKHLQTHPWVCQYREKRYVAVYRQATVKRWEFRQ
jgi:hypothetical protein